MNAEWMKTRQTRYTAYVVTYVIIIIGVLAAANWLANRYNKSYDSTSNKKFTLSDQTIKVVKGLKRDVNITYFDDDRNFQNARDLLGRYQNLSTRMHVSYVNPVKKPQIAKAAGVRSEGTSIVDSGAKKEEAKSLTEEEITSALIRSLKSGERNVCFLSGAGEHKIDDSGRGGYANFKAALERNNYKTRSVSLLQGAATPEDAAKLKVPFGKQPETPPASNAKAAEVPKDCTVLVIGGPKYDYPEPAVNAIKTYVESGGRALFMLDPPLKMQWDEVADNAALVKLIASWGITAEANLVLDLSGMGRVLQLGPEIPVVISYESSQIVRDMKEVPTPVPIARSLEVKSGDKTTDEKLFSTTDNSYAVSKLSGPITLDPKTAKKGPFVLAATGTFNGGDKDHQGRFVVVGSSSWVDNSYLRFPGGNRDISLNMMNWLSSDEDLISIRPKETEDRRLNLTPRQTNVLLYSSVVFLPLIVIMSGFMVWWRRR